MFQDKKTSTLCFAAVAAALAGSATAQTSASPTSNAPATASASTISPEWQVKTEQPVITLTPTAHDYGSPESGNLDPTKPFKGVSFVGPGDPMFTSQAPGNSQLFLGYTPEIKGLGARKKFGNGGASLAFGVMQRDMPKPSFAQPREVGKKGTTFKVLQFTVLSGGPK